MHRFYETDKDPFEVIEESGMEIPAIMGQMMERGYLITGKENEVKLIKVATDSDPKTLINPDFDSENRSCIDGIATKTHALAIYLAVRDLPETHKPKLSLWDVQVLFQIGRTIKIVQLDQVKAITYEEAKDLATEKAKSFVKNDPELILFGYKEVKVRPS